MSGSGVFSGDMGFRRPRDPLDAVLAGTAGDDAAELAAFVHGLTAAFVPDEPVVLRADVLRFTTMQLSAPTPATAAPSRRRIGLVAAIAAFVSTVAGKVIIGGALAAAAVGGLHATETVDVPFLPEVGRSAPPPAVDRSELPAEAPPAPVTQPQPADRPAPDTARPGVDPDPIPGHGPRSRPLGPPDDTPASSVPGLSTAPGVSTAPGRGLGQTDPQAPGPNRGAEPPARSDRAGKAPAVPAPDSTKVSPGPTATVPEANDPPRRRDRDRGDDHPSGAGAPESIR